MIWQQNFLMFVEECASDLADLLAPVIWQNCLSQRFGRITCASNMAELPV